jgi:uncharacterized protein YbbC (DUF1343 family)
MIYRKILILILLSFCLLTSFCQSTEQSNKTILPGAYRTEVYLPYLQGKKVGVFANQTSMVGQTHLVDTLRRLGINIVKIFAPEHGFRGTVGAGEELNNDTDKQTGIPIVSLYGKKVKPTAADLKDVDVLVFDIQDVGVRFYTYLSSLQYFMEGACENHKPLFILDRPNPNGFYIDGPVLDTAYKSFVGMQPIPVVYGMTIGEYARMIAGEQWLSDSANKVYRFYEHAQATKDTPIHFVVIKCANYTHTSKYQLPVAPSPNLPTMHAVYMYPSTCFFEGTNMSEGRGTSHPFEVFGHPSLPNNLFAFTPQSTAAAKDPKLKNQLCYGWNITDAPVQQQLQLKWILQAYQLFPNKDSFFIQPKSKKQTDYFFNRLAGNSTLMQQILSGQPEEQIRASWQPQLQAFKKIRKKYLLYEDFE